MFLKSYGFLSFDKYIAKNISKSLCVKYSTDAFKTGSKIAVQKIGETTSDLIGNKIADKSFKEFSKDIET